MRMHIYINIKTKALFRLFFIAELHAGADNELNVVKAVDFHPSLLADPAHLGDLLLATAADL